MLVKALTNFAGKVSMCVGEIREIADDEIAKDLLRAGYIEELKEAEVLDIPAPEEPEKVEEPEAVEAEPVEEPEEIETGKKSKKKK